MRRVCLKFRVFLLTSSSCTYQCLAAAVGGRGGKAGHRRGKGDLTLQVCPWYQSLNQSTLFKQGEMAQQAGFQTCRVIIIIYKN